MIAFFKKIRKIRRSRNGGRGAMYMRYYHFLVAVARLGLVGFLLYNLHRVDVMTNTDIIYYVMLGLYAVVFSALRLQKWTAFTEMVVVMTFTWFQSSLFLYFLWIVPTVIFATRNDKKKNILLYMLLVMVYAYGKTSMLVESLIASVVVGLVLYFFYSQFQSFEKVENELYKERNEKDGLKRTIVQKENEISQVSTMLIKSKELIDGKDVDEIINMMMEACISFFNSNYVVFYIQNKNQYVKLHEKGDKEGLEIPLSIPEEEIEGHRITLDMLEVDMRYQDRKWALIRIYGKRLSIGDRGRMVHVPFEEMDLEISLLYLYQVMVRIQDVELMQENIFRANYDQLTGLPNRSHSERHFEILKTLRKRGSQFSVVLFDIDKFKVFNDNFGHEVGDQVLKIVGQTAQNAVRETDFVGRWGGEEFIILLLNPNGREFEICEKVRQKVELLPIGKYGQVTISMGISKYGEHGTEKKELLEAADKALYFSKGNGRNQVNIYDDSMKDIMLKKQRK